MSTTLAIANQKGGVAKTTSVASIGAALAELGHRVLLVDMPHHGRSAWAERFDYVDVADRVATLFSADDPVQLVGQV